jgi:hypothetical protein
VVLCPLGHLITARKNDSSFAGSMFEAELGAHQAGQETSLDRRAAACQGAGHQEQTTAPAPPSVSGDRRYRLTVAIYADSDRDTPVAMARLVLEAPDGRAARKRAVDRTHDEHPAADERIHPIVRVRRTERAGRRAVLGWQSDEPQEG